MVEHPRQSAIQGFGDKKRSGLTSDHKMSITPLEPGLLGYLGGSIVIRTQDVPKNPCIPLYLHAILGPDYYLPHLRGGI